MCSWTRTWTRDTQTFPFHSWLKRAEERHGFISYMDLLCARESLWAMFYFSTLKSPGKHWGYFSGSSQNPNWLHASLSPHQFLLQNALIPKMCCHGDSVVARSFCKRQPFSFSRYISVSRTITIEKTKPHLSDQEVGNWVSVSTMTQCRTAGVVGPGSTEKRALNADCGENHS